MADKFPGVSNPNPDQHGGSIYNSRHRVCSKLHTDRNHQPSRRGGVKPLAFAENRSMIILALKVLPIFWGLLSVTRKTTVLRFNNFPPDGYKRREAHP